MRSRNQFQIILYGFLLMAGFLSGIIIQKYYGFGNILRTAGVPYPTADVPEKENTNKIVEIPQVYHGQMHLFVLAGQSNMVGWAPIPEDEKYDPRIYLFGNDYRWRIASHPIEDSSNQVDTISEDRVPGFGPAMDFAVASLERHPDIVIGLIPCAKSSTAIVQWQKNLSDQSLYGSCLKRVRAASVMGEISGVLFFQGETDTVDAVRYPEPPPHPTEWSDMFIAFVSDFRDDLNDPNLPVVFAQIGSIESSELVPNWSLVQEQQASVSLPMTSMIVTEDLPLLDGLHFTTNSYRIIGKRFAEAYWNMVESGRYPEGE